MNLDDQLHEELRLVAGDAEPSTPDIAGLIRAGSAHRVRVRRTRVVAGLAAAAVVVAGVVLAPRVLDLGDENHIEPTRAPTFEEMPVGPTTELPWLKDGVLHVGGETFDIAEPAAILYSGGTTVLMGEDGARLVDGKQLIALPGASSPQRPVISADGRQVAVAVSAKDRSTISLYDVEGDGVVLVATKEVEGGLNEVAVKALLPDGRVVYTGSQKVREFVWAPESMTTVARPNGAEPLAGPQWPGGVSVGDHYGTLDDRGRFHEVGKTPTRPIPWTNDLWDPSGVRILDEDSEPVPSFGDRQVYRIADESGRPVELLLPLIADYTPVAWETEDRVILAVESAAKPGLVRCDVETGGCERVGGVPDGSQAPVRYPV